MKAGMASSLKLLIVILLVQLTAACTTVSREYVLPSQLLDAERVDGMSRVVFYNDANVLLFPTSNRIGIKVDGKGVAAPYAGQYVQLDIGKGQHQLELSHFDIFHFRDEFTFTIDDGRLFVRVYATPLSTKFETSQEMPNAFRDGFRPIPE